MVCAVCLATFLFLHNTDYFKEVQQATKGKGHGLNSIADRDNLIMITRAPIMNCGKMAMAEFLSIIQDQISPHICLNA